MKSLTLPSAEEICSASETQSEGSGGNPSGWMMPKALADESLDCFLCAFGELVELEAETTSILPDADNHALGDERRERDARCVCRRTDIQLDPHAHWARDLVSFNLHSTHTNIMGGCDIDSLVIRHDQLCLERTAHSIAMLDLDRLQIFRATQMRGPGHEFRRLRNFHDERGVRFVETLEGVDLLDPTPFLHALAPGVGLEIDLAHFDE